jgi:hypothetical protein
MPAPSTNRLTLEGLVALSLLGFAAPWIPFGERTTAERECADLQQFFAERERQLVDAEQRHDWKYIDGRLSADFQEIGADGRIYTKQEIAGMFPSFELLDYKLGDMQVEPVAINVVLVTYTGEFKSRFQGKPGHVRVRFSTLWVRDSNYQYKARFHHVVPIRVNSG